MEKQTIYIGADHAGFHMKEQVESYLKKEGYNVVDMGNTFYVEQDDYPDFGHAVAKRVVADPGSFGILLCGNAQGICIVANKVTGIRAATGFNLDEVASTRTDDQSNILCLPARFITPKEAKTFVEKWLNTPYSNADRHDRRLQKIEKIEHSETCP